MVRVFSLLREVRLWAEPVEALFQQRHVRLCQELPAGVVHVPDADESRQLRGVDARNPARTLRTDYTQIFLLPTEYTQTYA